MVTERGRSHSESVQSENKREARMERVGSTYAHRKSGREGASSGEGGVRPRGSRQIGSVVRQKQCKGGGGCQWDKLLPGGPSR